MYNISTKHKSKLQLAIKLIVLLGAAYVITQKLSIGHDRWTNSNLRIHAHNSMGIFLWMAVVLCMSTANWVLEILRWRFLVKDLQNISFLESAKQSLSALTGSLLTPNRIGEYGVKAIYYFPKDRKRIMALNFLGNSYQMTITVIFGIFSSLILRNYLSDFYPFLTGLLLIMVFFIALYQYNLIPKIAIYKTRFTRFLKELVLVFHVKNLGFSLLRYLIFSHQFYLILVLFGIEIDYSSCMQLIFATYFIASIIPGFVALDFLIKGSVALTLFGFFDVNSEIILITTSLMWVLNFGIPAILGSYFVLKFSYPKTVDIKHS